MTVFIATIAEAEPPCHIGVGARLIKHPGYPDAPFTCSQCNGHWIIKDGKAVPYIYSADYPIRG